MSNLDDEEDDDPWLTQFLAGQARREQKRDQVMLGCFWFVVAIVVLPILAAAAIVGR